MAKIIVCVGSCHVSVDKASISYTVAVIESGNNYSYSADYEVDTTITVNNNLIAWRNKIIAQVAEKGIVVTAADVIVFGGPS